MGETGVPVFVALDVPDAVAARRVVEQLGDAGTHYKVGLELYLATGAGFVRELVEAGKHVFLDLKFHDIPNTVKAAVRQAAQTGAEFLTVHALGGATMLTVAQAAAQEAAQTANARREAVKLLAVTILTSHAASDLEAIGLASTDASAGVLRLAQLAADAGLHGVVCSPREVQSVRTATGLAAMVPGIRPRTATADDQRRVATPAEAVRAGASYLVVGRPVLRAQEPRKALLAIQEEVSGALAHKGE